MSMQVFCAYLASWNEKHDHQTRFVMCMFWPVIPLVFFKFIKQGQVKQFFLDQGKEMEKELIIMRGLPCCGKSYTAKELQKENPDTKIFSTDDFWYQKIKPEKPDEYNFVYRFSRE